MKKPIKKQPPTVGEDVNDINAHKGWDTRYAVTLQTQEPQLMTESDIKINAKLCQEVQKQVVSLLSQHDLLVKMLDMIKEMSNAPHCAWYIADARIIL